MRIMPLRLDCQNRLLMQWLRILRHLRQSVESAPYGSKAHSALEEARLATANAIGCERSELYFTSGGSEADNWAIKGTAELMAKKVKSIL